MYSKKNSIVNKNIIELESMDIDVVKKMFLDEVKSLAFVSNRVRDNRLQELMTKLFSFEPYSNLDKGNINYSIEYEHRLFVDLISIPELRKIDYFRDFLENKCKASGKNRNKKRLLIGVFNYYDKNSDEIVDKFNYIFRSSDMVSAVLLNNDIDLDKYFSSRILDSFDKEDLSQLFRFYFYLNINRDILNALFSEDNYKVLYMISSMAKKVKYLNGRSTEFLYSALSLCNMDNMKNILNEFYDRYVLDEIEYREDINKCNSIVLNELINYIINYTFDENIIFCDILDIHSLDDFIKGILKKREDYHNNIFNKDKFKDIKLESDLTLFKKAFLYTLYGISLEKAYGIYDYYCQYLEELENDIDESDKKTLEILKAIVNVIDLDLDDDEFEAKIGVLQNSYLDFILERGINYDNRVESYVLLSNLFNRMYINTYNKRLLLKKDLDLIEVDQDVEVFDVGDKFNIMLTSLSGANEYFDININMESKWNTASVSNSQGLCLSYISEQGLGTISLEAPLLGFSHIPECSLEVMGSSDIFSSSEEFCLCYSNSAVKGNNRIFVPASVMTDETRYGYNELLIDRFLLMDDNNNLKLQPDYVVFYKVSEDYRESNLYQSSLEVAKDFKIPIVVIDVLKIKENEKEKIFSMEEELFLKDECNSSLIKKIITRYMNNYTGSLTIVGSDKEFYSYLKDFSFDGLCLFLDKFMSKVDTLNDTLSLEWLSGLENACWDELRKYNRVCDLAGWNFSVECFLLDKLGYSEKINIKREIINRKNNHEKNEDNVLDNDSLFNNEKVKIKMRK